MHECNYDFLVANVGKEFVFGLIYCQWSPTITISIVSETPGNLWVRAPAVGIDSHYRAQAGTREITIPTQIMQTTNDSIENKAIHIVSDTNIAVNVIMSASLWHEGFLALPIHETAKEFVVATTIAPGTKLQPAEFLIASTKNGTQIAITFPKNNTITLTLNMHQTYQFQAMYDLSGTYIRSSAPISVTAGNAYSWFSPHAVYGSFFAEQMPSTDFSGSHFIIPSLIGRAKFFVKIVTSKDHSLITLRNSTNTYNLVVTRGHPLRLENTNGVIYITSDQPCLVAVFSWDHAIEVSGGGGEFMWVVPSISNYMMSYDFVIPTSQTAFSSHLFIISPTSNVSDIYLDSAPLAPSSRSTIQTNEGGFTTMSQKISTGKHTVTSRSGSTSFGALLFGENGGRGYGFPLGMKGASKGINEYTSFTL